MVLKCSWRVSVLLVASVIHTTTACGESDAEGPGGTSGAGAGGQSGGSAGSGGMAGSAGSPGKGGSAGTAGASGSAGASSAEAAVAAAAARVAATRKCLPPTDGGGSIYAVQCRGESRLCGFPTAHCLGIQLDEGGTGYTCSNHCQTDADCSSAPSGAEARAGCVQFTQQSRCVLVCENSGRRYSCPTGMSCYTYPGSPIGYCLWI